MHEHPASAVFLLMVGEVHDTRREKPGGPPRRVDPVEPRWQALPEKSVTSPLS